MHGSHGVMVPEHVSAGSYHIANLPHPLISTIHSRPLAWQEALIALASIFQKFDLVHNDPSYQLTYKYTLTVKPLDFRIRAIPRPNAPSLFTYTPTTMSPTASMTLPSRKGTMSSLSLVEGVPLYLAYGSNSGTCRDFAQRIGSEAPPKGFIPHIITLDSIETSIPTDGPLIIFTASYEGEPADNAKRFVETLQTAHHGKHTNVRFAVFGCGHHDWVQTYQRIPKMIDRLLEEAGAQRLLERKEADSGADEFFDAVGEMLWMRMSVEIDHCDSSIIGSRQCGMLWAP